MKRSVTLGELRSMSFEQRTRRLSALVADTRSPPNGEMRALDDKISAFEKQHGMNSADMRDGVRVGKVRETAEICTWLMILEMRDRLASLTTRTR